MKEHRHVFKMGRGYVFRLALPGHRFVSQEVQSSSEDAAFYSDVAKAYLASTFRLTGYSLTRSLAPTRFAEMLGEAGVDPSDVSPLLPPSFREYLELVGAESITAYVAAQAAIKSAKAFPVV